MSKLRNKSLCPICRRPFSKDDGSDDLDDLQQMLREINILVEQSNQRVVSLEEIADLLFQES
jgi:hypothetical protein